MIAEVQVHAIVVRRVFNHFECEAHSLGLPCHHVVGTLQIFKQLLLRAVGFQLVVWCKCDRNNLQDVLRQRLKVLINTFLNIVLMINHDDERTSLVWVRP